MYLQAVKYSSVDSFFQLIEVLVVFLIVLGLTYLTTKWIASYQKGQSSNHNLQVIETLKVTNNKYVQIVKAADEYLVIAIGKDEITLLTKLSEDQIPVTLTESGQKAVTKDSFQHILEDIRKRIPKK